MRMKCPKTNADECGFCPHADEHEHIPACDRKCENIDTSKFALSNPIKCVRVKDDS